MITSAIYWPHRRPGPRQSYHLCYDRVVSVHVCGVICVICDVSRVTCYLCYRNCSEPIRQPPPTFLVTHLSRSSRGYPDSCPRDTISPVSWCNQQCNVREIKVLMLSTKLSHYTTTILPPPPSVTLLFDRYFVLSPNFPLNFRWGQKLNRVIVLKGLKIKWSSTIL